MTKSTKPRVAVYALTRGYPFRNLYRYGFLIIRTWAIWLATLRLRRDYQLSWLLFHEGNITNFQQWLIQAIVPPRIQFRNVAYAFDGSLKLTESQFPAGYHHMCRFHYFHFLEELDDFDYGLRVDEDCFVLGAGKPDNSSAIVTGAKVIESHAPTLDTFLPFSRSLGFDIDKDELYPYTNFMWIDLQFFRSPVVKEFLKACYEHPDSFQKRWGDLPILGVASKIATELGRLSGVRVDSSISYLHMSHNSSVKNGELRTSVG